MFDLVRERYYNHNEGHLKSSNKFQPRLGEEETARSEQAHEELTRFRANVQYQDEVVSGTRAHNCGELTALVLHHCKQMSTPCAMLDIERTGHQLAVIGELPSHPLGNDMREWPANLSVVDVWAGVHGPANQYPDMFTQKMDGWAEKEKFISIPPLGGWVSANHEGWLDLVLNGRKDLINS